MTAGRRPWRRRVLWSLLLITVVAVLAATLGRRPLLAWMGSQLVHEDPPAAVDAAVILSGGFPNRELEGAAVYAEGLAPVLVVTREPDPPGMAQLRARGVSLPGSVDRGLSVLKQLGVQEAHLIVAPGIVESTADEAQALAELARHRGWRRILVVTSRWHTARARLVFQARLAPLGITVLTRGASEDRFDPATWHTTRAGLRNGVFEWQKLLLYRWQY